MVDRYLFEYDVGHCNCFGVILLIQRPNSIGCPDLAQARISIILCLQEAFICSLLIHMSGVNAIVARNSFREA